MKVIASILAGTFLLAGCSRQPAQPADAKPAAQADAKFETLTLAWQRDLPEAGMTNHSLIIRTATATATNVSQIDVDSLDQAANVLGQDGWKLITTDMNDGVQNWHMGRVARDDGKTFHLILYNPAWNNAKP